MEELIYTSATALGQAIRAKEVSSAEVVDACLERIEAVNPQLNAVVQLTASSARAEAREADAALARGEIKGPLHGVPITIKDSLETAGVVCTAGTSGRSSFVPTEDATVVARMRSAGAIILGKTNLPELAILPESVNLVYGRTSNPYDRSRTSGGSSGGEAAIIAAGGSPLGLGSDSGGSIRIPAHFCGIAGLKPTSGRVPKTGHFPPTAGVADSLWQIGPMSRFVEDLALALPIIAGVDWRDPAIVSMPLGDPDRVELEGLRVAFHTDNGISTSTPATAEAVLSASKVLSDAGMVVDEACPDEMQRSWEIGFGLWMADGGSGVQAHLQQAGTTDVHPMLVQLQELQRANQMSTAEFCSLIIKWDMFRSAMLSFIEEYDVIICPVCALPAIPHGQTLDVDKISAFSYTAAYNLTGWPAVVVRAGTSPEGLPIGVQVVTRPWREDVALAVARHIEKMLGGWQPPALSQ